MRNLRDYVPGPTDRDYIESTARPVHPVFERIEAEAAPGRIPILSRDAGRVLGALAAGKRRIVEVGTAYGYSTLWMALGQAEGGSIVTIDPDRGRTDIARAFWHEAGIPDRQITVVNRPALEAFSDGEPALAGLFDLAFIDALKPEYEAYFEAIVPRLERGALVVADNVLWSGRVAGSRDDSRADGSTEALRSFNARVLRDPRFNGTILPVGDGLLIAGYHAS